MSNICVCGHKEEDHDGPGEACGKCECFYYEHDDRELNCEEGKSGPHVRQA